jgi:cytochrome c oxidase subunit 2
MSTLTNCYVLALLALASHASAQDLQHGRQLYTVCGACHGKQAEGNRELGAPKLAGHTETYLTRQIDYFRQGIRGYFVYDIPGQQMALIALQLRDAEAIADVVAYIRSIPDIVPEITITGNIEHGRELFEQCVECHGPRAAGDEALSTPGLARIDDWYIVNQLIAFADEHRGTHKQDTHGSKMQPVLALLQDERNRNDLAAFIVSLR